MSNPFGVQMRIGHDLDGNLGNWAAAVRNALIEIGYSAFEESDPLNPFQTWNGWNDYGLSDEEFFKVYKSLLSQGVLNSVKPFDGQYAFLDMCGVRGHQNFIITHRFLGLNDALSKYDTLNWVNNNFAGVKLDGVIFSEDKYILETDVFFDDSVANIDHLIAAGCPWPVLIDQPYNRHRTDLDPIRIPNLPAIKMAVILQAEMAFAGVSGNPLAAMDVTRSMDLSFMETARELAVRMESEEISPDSVEGQRLMDDALLTISNQIGASVNDLLRLK